MEPDNIYEDVRILKKGMFGDPNNPKDFPGLFAQMQMQSVAQDRTNEILSEIREEFKSHGRWIFRLVAGILITAFIGLVMKFGGSP